MEVWESIKKFIFLMVVIILIWLMGDIALSCIQVCPNNVCPDDPMRLMC
jgi:hypothetical protein